MLRAVPIEGRGCSGLMGGAPTSLSCSIASDLSGSQSTTIFIQHLQYLLFGEPYVNEHTSSPYIERFTFTGKERDSETGYGYFGARYMDHELMTMWLSVDPLADKYPGISPYAYCAWNPVKLVDPDGKDVWQVNQYGELIWKQSSETDVIKASDGTSVKLAPGVLERGKSYRKEDGHFQLFLDKNDKGNEGQKLFEFLADHSRIEFSLLGVDQLQDDGSRYTCSILTTSFSSEGDDYGSELSHQFLGSLISHTHNHPSGYIVPSSSLTNPEFQGLNDRDFSETIKQNNPACRFFIYGEYQKGGEYREYCGENEGIRTSSKFSKKTIYTKQ